MQIIAVLIGILFLYLVQTALFSKYWNYRLNVSVKFLQTHLSEGDTAVLEECIENRKWLPMPMVTLKFNLSKSFLEKDAIESKLSDHYNRNDIFSILMCQRVRRKIDFICRRRGVYRIENLSVMANDFFFVNSFVQGLESDSQLTVYPKMAVMPQFIELYQNVYGDIITKQFMMEDPYLYRGVREYQMHDAIKMINWSATAKVGELKVNVMEKCSSQEVIVCLNLQKNTVLTRTDVLEECIRLAKTFCHYLSKKGLKPYLYTNGHDAITKELSVVESLNANQNYMDAVNGVLARIEVKENNSVYSENEELSFTQIYLEKLDKLAQSRYIIFISNYQREDFKKMLIDLKYKNRDFVWIVPVANRADYAPGTELQSFAQVWRLNWEGVQHEQ